MHYSYAKNYVLNIYFDKKIVFNSQNSKFRGCNEKCNDFSLSDVDCTTVCPGSSDPFCVVSYYIKWVTTSWTYSTYPWNCTVILAIHPV